MKFFSSSILLAWVVILSALLLPQNTQANSPTGQKQVVNIVAVEQSQVVNIVAVEQSQTTSYTVPLTNDYQKKLHPRTSQIDEGQRFTRTNTTFIKRE